MDSMVSMRSLRISRTNPNGHPSVFVNDLTVTHTDKEFFVTLSQVEPPVINTEDELRALAGINAIAVFKFMAGPEFIKAMIDTLSANLERYNQIKQGEEK